MAEHVHTEHYLALLIFTPTNDTYRKEGNKLLFYYILSSFTPCLYILSFPAAKKSVLGSGMMHKKEGHEFSVYFYSEEQKIQRPTQES